MTILPDVSWPGETMIDCDGEGCSMHIHFGRAGTKLKDVRMSPYLEGWKLDVDGKDYCPECEIPPLT